ncbi:MAG: Gfo/Idh/MocA family oxidoreductase [Solirubrobacteraceae bacterium]
MDLAAGTELGVGLMGCGNVSAQYLPNGPRLDALRLVACADVRPQARERVAAEHGLAPCTPEELLERPDVDVVLNLTPPDLHADVALRAIAAGKHVYTEKPLATSVERGRAVLDAAAAAGLLVGCAPDTFLGAGIETLRTALEGGAIGTPAIVHVRMLAPPPERWHPSPAFLYAELAGPLLDLGPYGVATAVALAGPVRRVTALASRPRATGTTAAGAAFPIAEPTRVVAVLEHDDGVLTTLAVSFDADGAARHGVEVTGSDGTLVGGDPNTFDGPVLVRRPGAADEPLALVSAWRDNARGLGLQDLCRAVRDGTPQRASGALGLHVLEVLLAARTAARDGAAVAIGQPLTAR